MWGPGLPGDSPWRVASVAEEVGVCCPCTKAAAVDSAGVQLVPTAFLLHPCACQALVCWAVLLKSRACLSLVVTLRASLVCKYPPRHTQNS